MGIEIPVSWGLDCRESKASEVADWRTFVIFVRPKKKFQISQVIPNEDESNQTNQRLHFAISIWSNSILQYIVNKLTNLRFMGISDRSV